MIMGVLVAAGADGQAAVSREDHSSFLFLAGLEAADADHALVLIVVPVQGASVCPCLHGVWMRPL